MADQIKGKRVPWSHMEHYLETHKRTITAAQDLVNSKVMDTQLVETILPNSFLQLYQVIRKILKDNNILPDEEETKVD